MEICPGRERLRLPTLIAVGNPFGPSAMPAAERLSVLRNGWLGFGRSILITGPVHDVICHLMRNLWSLLQMYQTLCQLYYRRKSRPQWRHGEHDAEPTDHKTKHIKKGL